MTNSKKVIDTIIVKPGISFKERILAGNYSWINYLLTESDFPNKPIIVGEWAFRLIHRNKNIEFEEAQRLCLCDGWQTARFEHLLALGEKFPEMQKEFPIVALGSLFNIQGGSDVPILLSYKSQRILTLNSKHRNFGRDIHFLSVHKIFKSLILV
ncbi:MAG: hypothetical protein QG630_84 [Patescibacteria group bacterium]|nr:hypothetical protein [Patescibacteria group bacterium]